MAELLFAIRNRFVQYGIRSLFIIPLVVPGVVGILVWVNIYDPNIGLLNQTLNALGLSQLTNVWLGNANTALAAIIGIGFPWVSPFALLIFYGGLVTIPQELFDAAKVDGASAWRRFWQVDVPLLMNQFKLLLILGFIGSVQEFQSVYLDHGRRSRQRHLHAGAGALLSGRPLQQLRPGLGNRDRALYRHFGRHGLLYAHGHIGARI